MVKGKVEALLRVSEVNLARAQRRLNSEEYDSAVFHASMAAENAANAMILKLGGSEARNHKAIGGLAAVIRRVKPELLSEEEYAHLIERGREIQREVVYARYPLKVSGKWVTPMEYYTQENAKRTIDHAKSVVDTVRAYIKRTKTRRNKC